MSLGTAAARHPDVVSETYVLGSNWLGNVLGTHQFHNVGPKETLIELARDRRIGYTNLKNANPDVDPWLPAVGQTVLLPHAIVLPVDARPGITINLAEMRLYFVWEERGELRAKVYPVGIGTDETESPTGHYSILSKAVDPTWTVPMSIRQKRPDMPVSVPPGPANPLGKFWMAFSSSGYGIHGTNKPLGVGRRVSHGCIRLFPQDIEDLFYRVNVGTPVQIINNPVKVGQKGDILFLEVHRTFQENEDDLKREVVRQARRLNWSGTIDWPAIERILQENRGIPLPIATAENAHSNQQLTSR